MNKKIKKDAAPKAQKLALKKDTLKDLSVAPTHGNRVKGGGFNRSGSTGGSV